jgi:hypothetical protein
MLTMDNDMDETFTYTMFDTEWQSSDEETPLNSPITAELIGVGNILYISDNRTAGHLDRASFQDLLKLLALFVCSLRA